MMIDMLQFMLQLLIAGFVFRYAQIKLAGSDAGKALAFIY